MSAALKISAEIIRVSIIDCGIKGKLIKFKAGPGGHAMAARHLPLLAEAVNRALAKAHELALLDDTRDNANSRDDGGAQ
jgi:hypothetical protein